MLILQSKWTKKSGNTYTFVLLNFAQIISHWFHLLPVEKTMKLYEYNFETSHVCFIVSKDHLYEFSLILDNYNGHGP